MVPDGRSSMPWGWAGRGAPGVRRLALSLSWAGPSGAGMSGPWARTTCPASAAGGSGHVIRAPAWHASMPCPDFRGACPALPWTAWPAYSLPSWLHGADASTMRDAPAPCPARPASPCGGAADGTLLPAEPPACPLRPLQASLLACLAPAPVLIPAHAPTQEAGVWRLPAGGCGGSRGSRSDTFPLPALRATGPSATRHYAAAQPRRGMDTAPPQGGARGRRGLRLRRRPTHGRGASPHGPAAGCPQRQARGRRDRVPSMPCPWCRRRERPAWHPVPWRIRQPPPVRGIIPASAACRLRHPPRRQAVTARIAAEAPVHGIPSGRTRERGQGCNSQSRRRP